MSAIERLRNWVAIKHEGQLIKRTTEPYFNHLIAVALLAEPATELGYEIGLCHDLLEDTGTTEAELRNALLEFGYSDQQANLITCCVTELTDVYTKIAYPHLSKSKRKKKETARLLMLSPIAQTVKYADLIYNINWMLKYDQKHAKRYLHKKQLLLAQLNQGDRGLWQMALNHIQTGLLILNSTFLA